MARRTIIKHSKLSKRSMTAYVVDAIGGGLCKIHGKYYGHGKHGLRDCPRCDIDEYYKKLETMKEKSNKGWFEESKPIITSKGVQKKAPRHHEVASKVAMRGTLREASAPEKRFKEPWRMTLSEYLDFRTKHEGGFRFEFSAFHRSHIEEALEEGEPVPLEVLADYPDLLRKVKSNVKVSR